MDLTRVRLLGGCGLATAVLFGAGACGSAAATGGVQPHVTPTAVSTVLADPSASASASTPASAPSSGSSKASGTPASSTASAAALPKSSKGDHQKAVEAMDAVAPSGLPIHRTADLGSTSRVYQAMAAHYGPQLLDLSATGYGDAESNASTYIVILGQLQPTPPLPNVVDGTLTALGATGIVAETKFGAHAAASSLVMSCGVLPNKYELCVWTGGTAGDLFLGAVETPAGMSLPDTAQFAESVFGYVAP